MTTPLAGPSSTAYYTDGHWSADAINFTDFAPPANMPDMELLLQASNTAPFS